MHGSDERDDAQDAPADAASGTPTPPGDLLDELVRRRAFEISQSPEAGTPEENWARAEREIRGPSVDAVREEELEAARAEESSAILNAEFQAFGHP